MNEPTFIETFAGIGGFRLGLERTGWKCLWANEWNKHSCQVYRKHFGGDDLVEGDIRKVDYSKIPNHELFVAGFPCQPFSMAGKREGFKDVRGTLFFEIARIIEAKRPKLLLFENVKGLLSAQGGYCFFRILEILDELGYDVEWQVLDSQHYGTPQHRERVFIIGHNRQKPTKNLLPIVNTKQNSNDRRRKEIKQVAPTISTKQDRGYPMIICEANGDYRFFTPLELERLQGFPDNWTCEKTQEQRYKMLGNAVTVNVIEYLGRLILDSLNGGKEITEKGN